MYKTPKRKRPETQSCPFHAKKKRKIMSSYSNKENYQHFSNLQSNKKNHTEYLYADPSFIREAKFDPPNRLEGGNVSEKDIFYDCYPCDYDSNPKHMMDKHLQIFEVINEIKNPKEFKSLLKQMAFTSNMLYRTFRQAYSKTKKNINSEKCHKVYDNTNETLARGDMSPLEIVNIEVPARKMEFVEDIRYESWGKNKNKKKKSSEKGQCFNDKEECFCYVCYHCRELNEENGKGICPICKGPMEEDLLEPTDAEEVKKYSQCDFKKEYKWYPQDSCLKETKNCDTIEDELKDLNFCERCAVLRGETPWPTKAEKEDIQMDITEKSSQTQQQFKSCKSRPCYQAPNISQLCPQTCKQILDLNPVCLTIPLKLQIDSENCQSRFIETEIVMETRTNGGIQSQKTSCLKQNPDIPLCCKTNPVKSSKSPDKSGYLQGSELYYSCISNSDIIKKAESQKICSESSLTEVLDIIKKRKPHSEDMPKTCQIASTKLLEDKGIQFSMASIITGAATDQKPLNTSLTKSESGPRPASYILDSKDKAKKLRSDLLEEVRSALEQTTPQAALKALLEGKRFSLPSDLRPKETPNMVPIRHSFPSNYQNITPSPKPLQPLKPLLSFPAANSSKPLIPPKPVLTNQPPKFTTETVQTDASAIKASGHYKRNEMRSEIQEDLKELLQPFPSKTQNKYKREERDEILLDLHKLFHPQKAGCLPKEISKENALQDINYLIKPEISGATTTATESQESIIECVKHILNPKSQAQKSKKKKYTKETKDKILEDLQIILKPRDLKTDTNQEIRNSVLYDLRFMLNTGQGTISPQRPARQTQLQHETGDEITGPGTSRAQQLREQRQQKAPNEIRDSLIADLRYMLDSAPPPPPQPSSPFIPPKPKKLHSPTSSEASLVDQEKTSKPHKVDPKKNNFKVLDSNKMEESSSDTFFIEMQDK